MNDHQKQEIPPFDEAIKQFQDFIAKQQISTDLLWVLREDVSSYKRRILIKQPLPAENLKIVELLLKSRRSSEVFQERKLNRD